MRECRLTPLLLTASIPWRSVGSLEPRRAGATGDRHAFLASPLVQYHRSLAGVIDQVHEKGKAQRFLTRACERDTLHNAGACTAICIHQECRCCLYEEQ